MFNIVKLSRDEANAILEVLRRVQNSQFPQSHSLNDDAFKEKTDLLIKTIEAATGGKRIQVAS
ncbi:MAG: hypothetical protein EOP04_07660 [Proteobacteria bacterium]|nr:MAG: hypothetical protein EOP04_07660 [Pseudomonadota bacterium]